MYRPNRIGPHQLVHLDQAPHNFGSFTPGISSGGFAPVVPDTTVREFSASRQLRGVANATPTGNQFTIGISVNGENPAGEFSAANDIGVLYECTGSIRWIENSGVGPQLCVPMIGRNDAATLNGPTGNNACTNYQFLDTTMHTSNEEGGIASFKQGVVLGNWDGGITYTDNPILLGWTVYNAHPSTAAAIEFSASLSIYKWVVDLKTVNGAG